MPDLKTYDLFISHAWRYNEAYYNLINLLDQASYFNYRNYSVPEHDPVLDPNSAYGKTTLKGKLDNQIRPVNCVLIISGMYASYSEWIEYEIDKAFSLGKPIIGLIPRGAERTPSYVQKYAKTMVGWSTSSIVNAIRRYSL